MHTVFFSLLKKEALEFIQNKKFILFSIVLVSAFAYLHLINQNLSERVYLLFIIFLANEYVFDSCYNDIRSGGALFFLNIRCKTAPIILAKAVYAVLFSTALFELAVTFVLQHFSQADILWFLLAVVFNTALVYGVTIIAKKSGILTSGIAMTVSFFILESLLKIPSVLIRALIFGSLAIVTILFSAKLSQTIHYRVEISNLKR